MILSNFMNFNQTNEYSPLDAKNYSQRLYYYNEVSKKQLINEWVRKGILNWCHLETKEPMVVSMKLNEKYGLNHLKATI